MPHDWQSNWGDAADTLIATLTQTANAVVPPMDPYPPNRGWGSVMQGPQGHLAYQRLCDLKVSLQEALGEPPTPNGPWIGGTIPAGTIAAEALAAKDALTLVDQVDPAAGHALGGIGWLATGEVFALEIDKATLLLRPVQDAVDPPGSIGTGTPPPAGEDAKPEGDEDEKGDGPGGTVVGDLDAVLSRRIAYQYYIRLVPYLNAHSILPPLAAYYRPPRWKELKGWYEILKRGEKIRKVKKSKKRKKRDDD